MGNNIWYPSVEVIVSNNKRVLKIFKATKADRHKVLGLWKLQPVINEAKKFNGSIEDKAAILLRGINQAHSFESANKRTAYFTANQFIFKNKNYWIAKKRDKQRDFAIKVREGKLKDKDISRWLS